MENMLTFGTLYDEHGIPRFFITDTDDLTVEPLVVLDYQAVQQLLGFATDYLITAEDYYEDNDSESYVF